MDKLNVAEQNLGLDFKFRYGLVLATCNSFCTVKLPNLKLKTQPKQLLGYRLLASSGIQQVLLI